MCLGARLVKMPGAEVWELRVCYKSNKAWIINKTIGICLASQAPPVSQTWRHLLHPKGKGGWEGGGGGSKQVGALGLPPLGTLQSSVPPIHYRHPHRRPRIAVSNLQDFSHFPALSTRPAAHLGLCLGAQGPFHKEASLSSCPMCLSWPH